MCSAIFFNEAASPSTIQNQAEDAQYHLATAEVDLAQEHIPEQRECVNELPQQGRVLLLLGEDRGLCGEATWTPKAACGPVCEGVRNPHLFHQCKDVVILQVAKHFVVTPAIQRCLMST